MYNRKHYEKIVQLTKVTWLGNTRIQCIGLVHRTNLKHIPSLYALLYVLDSQF